MSSKDYVIIKDGELVHFKYIKREKVNGEWRYYYDKGSIGRSIKTAANNVKTAIGINARNTYRDARDAAVTAEKERAEAYSKMVKEGRDAKETRDNAELVRQEIPANPKPQMAMEPGPLKDMQDRYSRAMDTVASTQRNLNDAKAQADQAEREYLELKKSAQYNDRAKKALDTAQSKYEQYARAVENHEKALAEAQKVAEKAKNEYNTAYKQSQTAKNQYKQDKEAYDKGVNKYNAYSNVASKQAKEAAEASRQNSAAAVKSQAAQVAAEEALKKYYKTPLGSLKFLSDKGKELLYKIF